MNENKRPLNLSSSSEGADSPDRKIANTMNTPPAVQADQQGNVTRPKEPNIVAMFEDLKQGQNSLKKSLESRIDRLRSDIERSIDTKLSAFKNDVYLDIGRLETRIEQMENEWKRFVEVASDRPVPMTTTSANVDSPDDALRSVDNCVIIHGIPYEEGENLPAKVSDLFKALGPEVQQQVTIVAMKRLNQRKRGKDPLVKVALKTIDEKIAILKAKSNLKTYPRYSTVWLRKSETHAERLLRLNMKKLLDTLPNGKDYGFTGSGRLMKKSELSEWRKTKPGAGRDSDDVGAGATGGTPPLGVPGNATAGSTTHPQPAGRRGGITTPEGTGDAQPNATAPSGDGQKE